jgi:peptidoglycan/LPS O-acetylase OafA/YrhL/rubredoxin
MKALVRCKACGFIMDAQKVEDVCPACGVPSKMFEAFTDNISEKRKWILDRHIHPVILHGPQGLVAFLFLFTCALPFLSGALHDQLAATIRVMAFCLPFTLVGAFFSGLLDAKVRFRRYGTPILRKKIVLGIAFFVLSLVLLFVTQTAPVPEGAAYVATVVVSGLALACGVVLGLLGGSILHARFPG